LQKTDLPADYFGGEAPPDAANILMNIQNCKLI